MIRILEILAISLLIITRGVAGEPKKLNKDQVKTLDIDAGFWLSATADEEYLVTKGSERGEIKWLRLPGFEPARTLKLDCGVAGVKVSPDGRFVAVYDWRQNNSRVSVFLAVYEVATKKRTIHVDRGIFAFSPDSRYIASAGDDTRLTVRNVTSGEVVAQSVTLGNTISHLEYSPDGRWIYASHYDLSCFEAATAKKVWDAERIYWGKEDPTSPHFMKWRCFSVSYDGQLIGASNVLFEAGTGRQLRWLRRGATSINCAVFDANARSLLGMRLPSNEGLLRWDIRNGEILLTSDPAQLQPALSAIFLRRHGLLVIRTDTGKLTVVGIDPVSSRKRDKAALNSDQLAAAWSQLSSDETPKAMEAMYSLTDHPDQTVPFLCKHLNGVSQNQLDGIRRLVRDLDSDQFRARQRAVAELAKLGDLARPALRQAFLDPNCSESTRKELNAVYEKIAGVGPKAEWLQAVRGVQVLGSIGNPKARAVLKDLAAKPSEDRIAEEARAVLERLARMQREEHER